MSVRYRATISPEAWINDYAVPVDAPGETAWIVDPVFAAEHADYLARNAERRRASYDDADGVIDNDDVFRYDPAAPAWVRDWSGPFTIRLFREAALDSCDQVVTVHGDTLADLPRLEAAFDEAGGRGVDLAERIDALRALADVDAVRDLDQRVALERAAVFIETDEHAWNAERAAVTAALRRLAGALPVPADDLDPEPLRTVPLTVTVFAEVYEGSSDRFVAAEVHRTVVDRAGLQGVVSIDAAPAPSAPVVDVELDAFPTADPVRVALAAYDDARERLAVLRAADEDPPAVSWQDADDALQAAADVLAEAVRARLTDAGVGQDG